MAKQVNLMNRTGHMFTIEAPDHIYTDVSGYSKLSTYGKGYIDGATDSHFGYESHPSIKLTSTDSMTRRAYVIGYVDGYHAMLTGKLPGVFPALGEDN